MAAGPVAPVEKPAPGRTRPLPETDPAIEPPWHVILLDDDTHTYDYVIEMLMTLFDHSLKTAFKMARTVDECGRVIVATVHQELAELRQEQIQTYGPDPRLRESKGSMGCVIEPAE
jgi:ATP-dependent Clp protease adaptor protein ClpS